MSNKITKMPPKPPVEFTLARKLKFLEHYKQTGLKYVSAELAGISTTTLERHQKEDTEFGELVKEAGQWWVDHVLVTAAVKRAVEGVSRPIVGGKFKDEIVCHEQVYSDGLLTLLLKAKRAEMREGGDGSGETGPAGGVMIIPAAPGTMDDWEASFGEDAKGNTGRPAGKK